MIGSDVGPDDAAAAAAEQVPVVLLRCSTTGRIAWANAAATHLLGVGPGDDLLSATEDHDRGRLAAFLAGLETSARSAQLELDSLAETPVELLATVDAAGVVTLAAYDVSAFRLQLDQARASARTDVLTGLANRAGFHEATQAARLAVGLHGAHAVLGLVDLDEFKRINDVHGHLAGDAVLRAVADRLAGMLHGDELVARLGGDEFGICFPSGGMERATEFANALGPALAAGFETPDGAPVAVTAALGLARVTADTDVELVLQEADVAMYRAKAGKLGWTVYTDGHDSDDPVVRRLGRTVEQLRRRADTDHRTGLARDLVFDADLPAMHHQASRSGTPISLLIVDLDHFHEYNLRYGYESGHRVLRAVAAALTGVVRSDDRCYRYGGEELAVLLLDTDADEARSTAERIRGAVEGLRIPHDRTERGVVTVSVGQSTASGAERGQPDHLVNGATMALFEAKDNGRNRVHVAAPTPDAPPIRARD